MDPAFGQSEMAHLLTCHDVCEHLSLDLLTSAQNVPIHDCTVQILAIRALHEIS